MSMRRIRRRRGRTIRGPLTTTRIQDSVDVAANFSLGTATTVAWWRFEEGTPNTAASGAGSIVDSSVHLNHGTPFGEPVYRSVNIPGVSQGNGVMAVDK